MTGQQSYPSKKGWVMHEVIILLYAKHPQDKCACVTCNRNKGGYINSCWGRYGEEL